MVDRRPDNAFNSTDYRLGFQVRRLYLNLMTLLWVVIGRKFFALVACSASAMVLTSRVLVGYQPATGLNSPPNDDFLMVISRSLAARGDKASTLHGIGLFSSGND